MVEPMWKSLMKSVIIIASTTLCLLFLTPLFMRRTTHYPGQVCLANLRTLCMGALLYADDHNDIFPRNMEMLETVGIRPNDFVCPIPPRSKPGLLQNVNQWADYIYIPGHEVNSPPDSMVFYCPPENHGGRYGTVGFADMRVERLKKDKFYTLLKKQGIQHIPKEP